MGSSYGADLIPVITIWLQPCSWMKGVLCIPKNVYIYTITTGRHACQGQRWLRVSNVGLSRKRLSMILPGCLGRYFGSQIAFSITSRVYWYREQWALPKSLDSVWTSVLEWRKLKTSYLTFNSYISLFVDKDSRTITISSTGNIFRFFF